MSVSVNEIPSAPIDLKEATQNWNTFYDFYVNLGPFREKEFYTHVLLSSAGVFFLALMAFVASTVSYMHEMDRKSYFFKLLFGSGIVFLIIMVVALAMNAVKKEEIKTKFDELRISDIYKAYPQLTYSIKLEHLNL